MCIYFASHIGGVMVSVVDHTFKHLLCQTRDYKIGICCFYANYAALRSKSIV